MQNKTNTVKTYRSMIFLLPLASLKILPLDKTKEKTPFFLWFYARLFVSLSPEIITE